MTNNNIKVSRDFPNFGRRQRLEIPHEKFSVNQIACLSKNSVTTIALVPPNHQLRRKQFAIALLNLDMDVWSWTTRIGDRFNRAQAKASNVSRLEAAESLEILTLEADRHQREFSPSRAADLTIHKRAFSRQSR